MAGYKVHRYHDISCGHRVVGHENKCRHLHGHNYRIHFTCVVDQLGRELNHAAGSKNPELDEVGRVIDFGVIKEKLCMWVEDHWDHKFLYWTNDPVFELLRSGANYYNSSGAWNEEVSLFEGALVEVPFNPTAENMAQYLVEVVGPAQLAGTGIKLSEVMVEETMKCFASYGA